MAEERPSSAEALRRVAEELQSRQRAEGGPGASNSWRRALYSDVELTRLRLNDLVRASALSPEEAEKLQEVLSDVSKQLRLRPVSKGNIIGKFFRMSSLTLSLIISGSFLALPMIALRSVDSLLHTDFSEKLRRAISHWLLLVSGVMVSMEGLDESSFQQSCSLLTFSHASNLDGFMISSSCPVRHYALAKKELFLVPFFSWISLAFGGVPVDRNNRERAISALQRSTEAATSGGGGKMCLVIAPEGTRSKTGQLNEFKKGAFHMWEQLKVPIVPFITYGAYDLYPVGSWINNVGRVHGRYLNPILPHEAKTRDEMSTLVRKRMLEALKDCPEDGTGLTATELICHYASINITWAASILICRHTAKFLTQTLGLSVKGAVGSVVGAAVAITVGLYVYYVYIVSMGASKKPVEKKKGL